MTNELTALRAVDFNWTRALSDVWTDPPYHVDDLNKGLADLVMEEFGNGTAPPDSHPIGLVIQGRAGAGKTHLIGTLRRRVWEAEGWFVLIDIVGVTDFWQTTALSLLHSLYQTMPSGRLQYHEALDRVWQLLRTHPGVRGAVTPNAPVARHATGPTIMPSRPISQSVFSRVFSTLRKMRALDERAKPRADEATPAKSSATDTFLTMLMRLDPVNARKHQDVVRALILLRSKQSQENNFAYYWLQGQNIDDDLRRHLNFPAMPPKPIEIVQGLLWFLGLTGPTMIAIDQIDSVVSASNRAQEAAGSDEAEARRVSALIEALALGLIELHEFKRRAMTVVSCLEVTWPILTARAIEPFRDRFSVLPTLAPIDKATLVGELVAERLAKAYFGTGFAPPYPTWPFRPEAIDSAVGLRPRQILIRCQEHRRACLAAGQVSECATLAEAKADPIAPAPPARLDDLYAQELRNADPKLIGKDEALDAQRLVHVCELYLGHLNLPEDVDGEVKLDAGRPSPSLHATLAFVFHDQGDRQQRWCFRWLPQDNAIAFQSRLKAAMTASGIDTALKFRHLVILREGPPPSGEKTRALVEQFLAAGGKFVALDEADRRALLALIALADRNLPDFEAWLRARRPLFATKLFKVAGLAPPEFLAAPPVATVEPAPEPARPPRLKLVPRPAPEPTPPPPSPAPAHPTSIRIGRRLERGALSAPVSLDAALLPRHIAILAGTGSGKTVLLRRVIEEAALIGLPAVLLDANNDLSRLGEPWPNRPEGFSDEDAAKAAAYRERAEVVIWTPGVSNGNPLSLNLLPDFTAIGAARDAETEDERAQAIEMALATLDPLLGGTGRKAVLKRGVLADALRAFALAGGGSLDVLISRLAEFDPDESKIGDSAKLAAEMADQLNAMIAADPLLRATAPSLDPALLFAGSRGKTRISVINLAGLASDAAKEAFVNQLQMALFTWIKQNPSSTGRLYALDEARNFVPSQTTTACKRSALALVAQARKYGLGMIFATQQPKGIDNAVVSNCTTHFYGRVSSPTAIDAIKEMAAAKGGAADDIARLNRGEFYYSTEGSSRPVKIQAPLCLSWHPANPPTAEEVAAMARRTRPAL